MVCQAQSTVKVIFFNAVRLLHVIVYQPTIQILYKSNLQPVYKYGKFNLPPYHNTYYSVESTCTV